MVLGYGPYLEPGLYSKTCSFWGSPLNIWDAHEPFAL